MIVPIVFAFDSNLLMPAGVCISSLLKNAHADTFYDIYILYPEGTNFPIDFLSRINRNYKNYKITYRAVADTFSTAYEIRGISTPTYYRLIIPEIIPEWDKILYSDVDVIFREDMSAIYQTDLSEYYLAGVDNCSFLRPAVQRYLKEELNLDYQKGYFYAGNLIINSKLLRKDGIVARFKELACNKYKQQDMDILNIVCNGHIKKLPPFYCLTNYIYELIVTQKENMLIEYSEKDLLYALDRGIIHYNGQKPWQGYCLNFDIWWEYYRKSPFFDEKFYFNFFHNKLDELEQLSLMKRIKILVRYFVYGRKKV